VVFERSDGFEVDSVGVEVVVIVGGTVEGIAWVMNGLLYGRLTANRNGVG